MDDPNVLSKVLGEKLWWRWVKDPRLSGLVFGKKNMLALGKIMITSGSQES